MRLDAKAAAIMAAGRGFVNDLAGESAGRAVKSSIGDEFADGIRPHLKAR